MVRDRWPLPVETFPRSPLSPSHRSWDTLDRPQPHSLLPQQTGRWRSWENQPGVPGWEKRPGGDLLRSEALLWEYLPGAAGCRLWLSVATPGPGMSRTWSTQLHYSGGPGDWSWHQHGKDSGAGLREPQSHTLTLSIRKAFSKVYFFIFPKPHSLKLRNQKGQRTEAVTTSITILLDLGNKQETNHMVWTFSCFYCLILLSGFIFLRRMH